MRCPNCDEHFAIEGCLNDWNDTTPFEAPCCSVTLRLVVDEGTYRGARDEHLDIVDDTSPNNQQQRGRP
jgi:hypothetical protein